MTVGTRIAIRSRLQSRFGILTNQQTWKCFSFVPAPPRLEREKCLREKELQGGVTVPEIRGPSGRCEKTFKGQFSKGRSYFCTPNSQIFPPPGGNFDSVTHVFLPKTRDFEDRNVTEKNSAFFPLKGGAKRPSFSKKGGREAPPQKGGARTCF